MKFALVNPKWSFEGSTYFGCPEAHFPLELLSAREMLRTSGQEVLLIDAWMEDLSPEQVIERLDDFGEARDLRLERGREARRILLAHRAFPEASFRGRRGASINRPLPGGSPGTSAIPSASRCWCQNGRSSDARQRPRKRFVQPIECAP